MISLTRSRLLTIAGGTWIAIGALLLNMGVRYLMQGAQGRHSPLFSNLVTWSGGTEEAVALLTIIGCLLGYIKGRTVLRRAAHRTAARLEAANTARLSDLYNKGTCALILVMMLLGQMMSYFDLAYDIRGLIDTAVGLALLRGGATYFQLARTTYGRESPS